MERLWVSLISFLAILNPFAMCLYLGSIVGDLERKRLLQVVGGACVLALLTFWICGLAGETILVRALGVRPAALRVLGEIKELWTNYLPATAPAG